MIARLLFVLTALCLLSGKLQGTITQIENLERFEQTVANLGTCDLVLFDVDSVLLVPDDAILRPVGKPFLKKLIAMLESNANYSKEDLWGRVLAGMTVSLVDERMPSVVRALQQRDIPTIAFTACWSGKLGPLQSCADWRIGQLRELGFDFSRAFSHVGFWQHSHGTASDHPPTFKSGVLFSPHQPKGDTLQHFLKAAAWMPKCIVFIDDREDYLKSVEAAAKDLGIEFQGFHYTAVLHLPCTFDERIADIQLRHLVEQGEWLSDSVLINNSEFGIVK